MQSYACPNTANVRFQCLFSTQSVSGGLLTPLSCAGNVEQCDVISLGADCRCGDSLINIRFLVPGVSCSDIHNGADCTITPACSNPFFSAIQCSEGCVVGVDCDSPGGCSGVDVTVSCPGFEDCSSNTGAAVC